MPLVVCHMLEVGDCDAVSTSHSLSVSQGSPVLVTRDVTGSHGYVTRMRLFFLFPISPLLPSRDLGPTVPLHGPALYHMT